MTLINLLVDGLKMVYGAEGVGGLWRGSTLALVGVSNGAVQFMAYEEMKKYSLERARRLDPSNDVVDLVSFSLVLQKRRLWMLTLG